MALSLFGRIRTVHAVLFGRNYLNEGQYLAVDTEGGLHIIDQAHAKVHAGVLYVASHRFAGVASAGTATLQILTGATKRIHLGLSIAASAEGHYQIFEGITSTVGTAITPVNLNRVSANVAEPSIVHTPTVSDFGTELPIGDLLPGGARAVSVGGADGDLPRGPEIILKSSTKYLVQFTNDSVSASNISIGFGFYEVTI